MRQSFCSPNGKVVISTKRILQRGFTEARKPLEKIQFNLPELLALNALLATFTRPYIREGAIFQTRDTSRLTPIVRNDESAKL